MKLRLNGKKVFVKTASNMTVTEYINYFSKIKEGDDIFSATLLYLSSIFPDLTFADILYDEISDETIRKINAYCELPIPVDQLPETNEFYYGYTGQRFTQNLNWRAVGVRLELRKSKNKNKCTEELIVYLLAILITDNFDSDQIEKSYQRLLNYNAVDVFSFGYFFFQKLANGSPNATIFSKLKKLILNMSIPFLLKTQ